MMNYDWILFTILEDTKLSQLKKLSLENKKLIAYRDGIRYILNIFDEGTVAGDTEFTICCVAWKDGEVVYCADYVSYWRDHE